MAYISCLCLLVIGRTLTYYHTRFFTEYKKIYGVFCKIKIFFMLMKILKIINIFAYKKFIFLQHYFANKIHI